MEKHFSSAIIINYEIISLAPITQTFQPGNRAWLFSRSLKCRVVCVCCCCNSPRSQCQTSFAYDFVDLVGDFSSEFMIICVRAAACTHFELHNLWSGSCKTVSNFLIESLEAPLHLSPSIISRNKNSQSVNKDHFYQSLIFDDKIQTQFWFRKNNRASTEPIVSMCVWKWKKVVGHSSESFYILLIQFPFGLLRKTAIERKWLWSSCRCIIFWKSYNRLKLIYFTIVPPVFVVVFALLPIENHRYFLSLIDHKTNYPIDSCIYRFRSN